MEIKISEIIISPNRREVDKTRAGEIAESVKQIGLLNPITLDSDNNLIAGAHRIEAFKILELDSIPFRPVDLSGLQSELAEIDENLIRNELNVLERSEQLLRRKEIYEELYPESKQGISQSIGMNKNMGNNVAAESAATFTKDVKNKTGKPERTTRKEIQIAKNIIPEVKEALKKTGFVDRKTDLLEIARMKPEAQKEVIETIKTRNPDSLKKALQQTKAENLKKTLQDKSEELPTGIFQVIYADPPWQYSNGGLNGSANKSYLTMPTEDICNLPVNEMADTNSVCFMWATNPLLEDALKVMKSWGFAYKTNIVWDKEKSTYGRLGFYVYGSHELLLIGTKGSLLPIGEKPNSVIRAKKTIHSKKPDKAYEIIEMMYPELKCVELFSRNLREGWEMWGNQIKENE